MRRGFTLVEVLVASALLLLLLGLTFGYLVPALRGAGRVRVLSQLQQTSAVVFSKIQAAASTTAPGGLSWSSGGAVEPAPGAGLMALGFNPVDELQGVNALLRWTAKFELFWWDREAGLLRQRSWPPGPPSAVEAEATVVRAKRLGAERLAEVVGADAPSLILARGVTDFRVTQRGDDEGELIQPITVSLTLVEPGREKSAEGAVTLTQRLVFRVESQQ